MAILFDDASLEYLDGASELATVPFTMACWFKTDQTALWQGLMSQVDQDGTTFHHSLITDGSAHVGAYTKVSGTSGAGYSFDTYSANTWHHACGVWVSAEERKAYLDGAVGNTDTTVMVMANVDAVSIGAIARSTPYLFTSGSIAEAAIWNINLSANRIAALAAGAWPPSIRPDQLVGYWPMHNVNMIDDIVGDNVMTAYNTPVSSGEHPSIIYPHSPRVIGDVSGGAPPPTGTILPQITQAYMRVSA